MLAAISRHSALRILVSRALVLFVLVTILSAASQVDSPIGVVLLVALLGWIDLRRRRESLFWANLGYNVGQTTGVVAAVALAGTIFVTAVARPLVESVMQNAR